MILKTPIGKIENVDNPSFNDIATFRSTNYITITQDDYPFPENYPFSTTDSPIGWNLFVKENSAGNFVIQTVDGNTENDVIEITRNGLSIFYIDGIEVKNGDVNLDNGDLVLSNGNVDIINGIVTISTGDLNLNSGNITISTGDLNLNSGNINNQNGQLTINNIIMNGRNLGVLFGGFNTNPDGSINTLEVNDILINGESLNGILDNIEQRLLALENPEPT